MKRALCSGLLLGCLWCTQGLARTGEQDPTEVFREREVHPDTDLDWVLHAQLRARGAAWNDADLGLVSPTTKAPPFATGAVAGADLRARVTPSLFIGDELRLFADVDAVALGAGVLPTGVTSTADPALQSAFLDVRALGVDWLLPIGVVSVGRAPSRFGLGLGTHDGAGMDDDGGDRADRISLVMPVLGHLLAAAFDIGPGSSRSGFGPTTRALSVGEQAVAVGAARWHAPWEVALYREGARPLLDYGAALSFEWMSKDVPGLSALWAPPAVRTDARLLVLDAWLRFFWGPLSVEGEAWAGDLFIDNPSPWPGVTVRQPLTGNPFAGAVTAAWQVVPEALSVDAELGLASSDPAPGFPTDTRSGFARAVPGDVTGPQIDLARDDARVDAARIHPLHRVDLILWRSVLGGVSEAGYARAGISAAPASFVTVDAHAIYSQALDGAQTPGGVAPLGLELDVGAEVQLPLHDRLSARVDLGALQPLGGMATRGSDGAPVAVMALGRIGYAL